MHTAQPAQKPGSASRLLGRPSDAFPKYSSPSVRIMSQIMHTDVVQPCPLTSEFCPHTNYCVKLLQVRFSRRNGFKFGNVLHRHADKDMNECVSFLSQLQYTCVSFSYYFVIDLRRLLAERAGRFCWLYRCAPRALDSSPPAAPDGHLAVAVAFDAGGSEHAGAYVRDDPYSCSTPSEVKV